jgi:peptidoglycan/LPS O-acetylase OafA/YrhL
MEAGPVNQGHVQFLDGPRGLAAIIVVAGHCSNGGIHVIPGVDLAATAKIGVWLFFALSAYLLTGRLLDQVATNKARHVFAAYGIRRVLRILPLYYIALLYELVVGSMDVGTALRHAALIEGRLHFWTIPVEMSFYAMLPFLVLALARLPTLGQIGLVTFLLLAGTAWFWFGLAAPRLIQNSIRLDMYAVFFLAGAFVAVLDRNALNKRQYATVGVLVLIVPVLAPRSVMWLTGWSLEQSLDFSFFYSFIWAAGLLGLLALRLPQTIFAHPVLSFVGKASFGIYLFHWFIIPKIINSPIPHGFKGLTVIALSIAVGAASHYAVETFVENWGKAISRKILSGQRSGVLAAS